MVNLGGSPRVAPPIPQLELAMHALLVVIIEALNLLYYVILIAALMSWLVGFNVINLHNNFVRMIYNGFNAVSEPLLRPIRRILPNLGGVDISPIIAILIIMFIQQLLIDNQGRFL